MSSPLPTYANTSHTSTEIQYAMPASDITVEHRGAITVGAQIRYFIIVISYCYIES